VLVFPLNPVAGQTFHQWIWDGEKWASLTSGTIFAPLNSPAFTGEPTAFTPPFGDDSLRLATTQFVQRALDEFADDVYGDINRIVKVQQNPPPNPRQGDLWWKTRNEEGGGTLYIWYEDDNSAQWVDASPSEPGPQGPRGETAEVELFTSSEDGIVPASGGGSIRFLRSDRQWVEPIEYIRPTSGNQINPTRSCLIDMSNIFFNVTINLPEETEENRGMRVIIAGWSSSSQINCRTYQYHSNIMHTDGYTAEPQFFVTPSGSFNFEVVALGQWWAGGWQLVNHIGNPSFNTSA
jgi:hypothetical protein